MAKQLFNQPCATLPTGALMPLMAFGTLMENIQPEHGRVVKIIETALDIGYRHFDTAQIYHTEPMVGEAVRNKMATGLITRDDVFITTKLWRNSFQTADVVPSLKQSLKRLQMDYVDLFLIHWPTAFKPGDDEFPRSADGKLQYADIDPLATWRGMEECYKLGLARAIGLSNFNHQQIQRILDNSSVLPANQQVESHPYLTNTRLIRFCQERGISVMAYAPLVGFNPTYREQQGWPEIFTDTRILKIAEKHHKTAAQVALRFQLERGVGVAPKSAKEERMKENFDSLFFTLDKDDISALEACDRGYRLNAEFPDHPHYPFHEEF